MRRLVRHESQAQRWHVILDNDRIPSREIALAALRGYLAGKVELHFLPPYCPDDNKIDCSSGLTELLHIHAR